MWAGKASVFESAERFVIEAKSRGVDYDTFARRWIRAGHTPLFEWCEKCRVAGVVRHSCDSLTLCGIRCVETGQYMGDDAIRAAAAEHSIPLVGILRLEDLGCDDRSTVKALASRVSAMEAVEGVVLTLADGVTMLKVKTAWWTALASASKRAGDKRSSGVLVEVLMQRPRLFGLPPEVIWGAALHPAADDALPMALRLLHDAGETKDANRLRRFLDGVGVGREALERDMIQWGAEANRLATEIEPLARAMRATYTEQTNTNKTTNEE